MSLKTPSAEQREDEIKPFVTRAHAATPFLQQWDHKLGYSIRATAWVAGRVLPIFLLSALTSKDDHKWTIKSSLILGAGISACMFVQDFTENVVSNTPSQSLLARGIHWLTNSD